ncbi:MAG: cobalamin-binding protein [Deltaproteobacteria bacterium]|nr:cobalamin-binding protein [Deltaproteobacteria bacterium]
MQFLDDLQRPVTLPARPRRIICLVPSITETLFALGVGDRVVGVTAYCTHPPERVALLPKLGGTKDPNREAILRLEPDLLILNDEENRQEDFTWFVEQGLPVYVTSPRTVAAGITMIEKLGSVLSCQSHSEPMVQTMRAACAHVAAELATQPRLRVFCPIWRKPWMTFNHDTYSDDMLWTTGGENVLRDKAERYFSATLEEVEALSPQVVLLPSEPYPFETKHFVHLKPLANTPAGRGGHFYCIDGMALCWYGPRILEGLEQLSKLFAYVRATIDD